jgi:hypothetical protein
MVGGRWWSAHNDLVRHTKVGHHSGEVNPYDTSATLARLFPDPLIKVSIVDRR